MSVSPSRSLTAAQAFQLFFSHFLIISHALLCSSAKNPSSISLLPLDDDVDWWITFNYHRQPTIPHTTAACKFQCNRPDIKASRWVLKLMPISLAWNFINTFLNCSSSCRCSTKAAPCHELKWQYSSATDCKDKSESRQACRLTINFPQPS